MDPKSNDYQFGVFTTQIANLTIAVTQLTAQVTNLANEVGEIKLFRAKVVGMSITASIIVSFVATTLSHVIVAWAK